MVQTYLQEYLEQEMVIKGVATRKVQKLIEDLSDPYPGVAELLETGGEDTLTLSG